MVQSNRAIRRLNREDLSNEIDVSSLQNKRGIALN